MTGRPEGTAGGYNDGTPEEYDRDAWQAFTPWRPGDPSTQGEAPASYAAGFEGTGLSWPQAADAGNRNRQAREGESTGQNAQQPRGRWWTEEQPTRFERGDRVRSRSATGGSVFCHVPAGTEGRVTGTRSGLFGGDFATVEFDNGYTEEVPTSQLKQEGGSWF